MSDKPTQGDLFADPFVDAPGADPFYGDECSDILDDCMGCGTCPDCAAATRAHAESMAAEEPEGLPDFDASDLLDDEPPTRDDAADVVPNKRERAIRILHMADLHINESATMGGAVRQLPDGTNLAMHDLVEQVRACISQAKEHGDIDGVVIAGDVFHTHRPTANEYQIAGAIVDVLSGACASRCVLVIPGNHDMSLGTSDASAVSAVRWHYGAMVIETPRVVDYAGLRFGCLPYPRRGAVREMAADVGENASENEALSVVLKAVALNLLGQGAQVLLAHATVTGATIGEQPRPVEGDIELDIDTLSLFEAAMLGHIHQPQSWLLGGTREAAYAGSPIVNNFGEADGRRRGAQLWTFDAGSGARVASVRLGATGRQWATIDFEATLEPFEEPLDFAVQLVDGAIHRWRGKLPGPHLDAMRAKIRSLRAQGYWIQDELQVAVEDRLRAEVDEDLDDDAVIRRAMESRDVPQEQADRAMAVLADIKAEE